MPFEWSDLVESDVMDALGVSLFSQNHNYIEKLKLGEFVKMTLLWQSGRERDQNKNDKLKIL